MSEKKNLLAAMFTFIAWFAAVFLTLAFASLFEGPAVPKPVECACECPAVSP